MSHVIQLKKNPGPRPIRDFLPVVLTAVVVARAKKEGIPNRANL